MTQTQKDRPWLIRTYAGHSTAQSVERPVPREPCKGPDRSFGSLRSADSDRVRQRPHSGARRSGQGWRARSSHLGDMRVLFDQIPLEQMNTSMTINATAPWLLALYIAVAEEQGADVSKLQGTVQNDMIKEYLSRGTYVCPPKPSLRMIADVAEYCYARTCRNGTR